MSTDNLKLIVTLAPKTELALGLDNQLYILQRNSGNVIKAVVCLGPNTDNNIEGIKGCLDQIHAHHG